MASSPLRIVFVTGNAKKLEEVTAILGTEHSSRFVLDSLALDLPELQGTPADIAKGKARLAAERVKCACCCRLLPHGPDSDARLRSADLCLWRTLRCASTL
jgi:Ham1 family